MNKKIEEITIKIVNKRKYLARLGIFCFMVLATGCSRKTSGYTGETGGQEAQIQTVEDVAYQQKIEDIAYGFQDIYQPAKEEEQLSIIETLKEIVNRIAEIGYVVVDAQNQIDMIHGEQMMDFIKQVDAEVKSELTLVRVGEEGDFWCYDFVTSKGKVDVKESYVAWNENKPEVRSTQEYNASQWKYTDEGYLFFEQYHMPGYDGASGHNAVRVQPLEEKYRQLNQKYILPIGYELNNLFLVDWNEKDFGQLDFYDLFDLFYEEIMKKQTPYVADDNSGVGVLYEIGIEEFEGVIQSHLRIDSATLQSKVSYFPEKQSYEYRPRGLYDCEEPSYPYPEVVNYAENEDGTITLKVHAVYPNHNRPKAYAHEVVIRPMDNGNYQYVSNHVIPDDNNDLSSWRKDRLTKEAWEKFYGSNTKVRRMTKDVNKGYDLQVDSAERDEAVADCKKIMAMVEHEAPDQIQTKLGGLGNPVSTSEMYSNMENYRKMEVFLENSDLGMQGEIVMYEVHTDGGIKRNKYIFDGADMYVLESRIEKIKEGIPRITYIVYTKIKEWKYTDKGWFCYELCVPEPPEVTEIIDGSNMIRIKPMEDKYREISRKCVLPMAYQGNNLLCSNWDTGNLKGLDYNGMYEYLYSMKYEKGFAADGYPDGIPKEEFENVIMEFLPVTVAQIQKQAVFHEETGTYAWTRLGCLNYNLTSFGTSIPEVTDIRKNDDGTVTLTVDAVCERGGSDDAIITHELTMLFNEDGSFRYLGNKILGDGAKKVPEYKYRIQEN